MSEARSLRDLMRIRAQNREFLESISRNLGTALGFKKRTGQPLSKQPAIIVFVPQKINPKWIPEAQLIPDKLEGPDGLWCALDVVEGGKAETEEKVPQAVDELSELLRGWGDKVWCGSQISHWVDENKGSYSMGTLGAFVKSRTDGAMGFLTNQHIGIEPGQTLYHPVPWGKPIGTTRKVIEYIEDQDWYGVDENEAYVRCGLRLCQIGTGF